MHFNLRLMFCLTFILSLFMSPPFARAGDEKEAGRAVLSKWSDAVIAVKATTKVRIVVGGAEQSKEENEIETLATVIDPSGLAVLSFSSIDPAKMFEGLLKKLKASKEGPEFSIDTNISGITMVLADGREIPAKLVMRDGDLDLAFVRPTEKLTKPVAALDISGENKPAVLDSVLILSRLDKTAGRNPSISLNSIEAVVTTPRKFYVADSNTLLGRLGAPVFSLDGKVVGFSLMRITKTNDKSMGMGALLSNRMNALGMMPIILPTGEVAAVAKQAMSVKD